MNNLPIILAGNLSFRYNNSLIFKELSFEIGVNQKVALIGSSGTGKTTLLNLLMGFEVDFQGDLKLFNETIQAANVKSIRSRISYLPQNINYSNQKVNEVFEIPHLFNANRKNKPEKIEIKKIFDAFKLEIDLLDRNIFEISTGQMHRVMLASVLLLNKPLVILDEPTAALDEDVSNCVFEYMSLLNQTIICSTHNTSWLNYANLVIDLNK